MGTAIVHYQPLIPPLRPKADCRCAGPDALVIGSRIERRGRSNVTNCDALLCMACGTIKPVGAEFNHYHHALAYFWKEWGWHRTIGLRLTELADLSTSSPLESYLALRSGMSPEETAAYLAKVGTTAPAEKKRKRRTA